MLVGVSGGPDSTALLLLFAELKARDPGGFPELIAGHVHHGLRGEGADRDAEFAAGAARALGIECLVERVDARAEARRRSLSLEAAGRALRYDAFARWARERGIDAVALAHHADDQAETVLLRALRGTGLKGLAGIPRDRPLSPELGKVRVIRPLLDWSRASILEYLESRAQAFRTDESNADEAIPRNFLRRTLLPLVEARVHPGARAAILRLSEVARRAAEDLRALGARALVEARAASGGGPCLDLAALRRWPPSVVLEALRLAIDEAAPGGAGGSDLGFEAFQALLAWLREDGPPVGRIDVAGGGGLSIELRYGLIRIAAGKVPAPEAAAEALLSCDGRPVRWKAWELAAEEAAPGASLASAGPREGILEERVDAAAALSGGPLRVRSRLPADRIWPLGAPGAKKLKELFRERRVWPSERDAVPLIVSGREIVWAVGHRIGHAFRLRPETGRVLVLRAWPARGA